jgi:hypothetical protein
MCRKFYSYGHVRHVGNKPQLRARARARYTEYWNHARNVPGRYTKFPNSHPGTETSYSEQVRCLPQFIRVSSRTMSLPHFRLQPLHFNPFQFTVTLITSSYDYKTRTHINKQQIVIREAVLPSPG